MDTDRQYKCGDFEIELFGNGFTNNEIELNERYGFTEPVPRLYITQNKKDIKMTFEYFGNEEEEIPLTLENLLAIRVNVDKLIERIENCK